MLKEDFNWIIQILIFDIELSKIHWLYITYADPKIINLLQGNLDELNLFHSKGLACLFIIKKFTFFSKRLLKSIWRKLWMYRKKEHNRFFLIFFRHFVLVDYRIISKIRGYSCKCRPGFRIFRSFSNINLKFFSYLKNQQLKRILIQRKKYRRANWVSEENSDRGQDRNPRSDTKRCGWEIFFLQYPFLEWYYWFNINCYRRGSPGF